jgi:hypothetical protein
MRIVTSPERCTRRPPIWNKDLHERKLIIDFQRSIINFCWCRSFFQIGDRRLHISNLQTVAIPRHLT